MMEGFIVISIRDFPKIEIGWRHSYIVGHFTTMYEAKKMAIAEIESRGGKYGCVIYDATSGEEVFKLSRKGHENKIN